MNETTNEIDRSVSIPPPSVLSRSWVDECLRDRTLEKKALGKFAAERLVFGTTAQIGSGTTFKFLIEAVAARQVDGNQKLEMLIMTTNFCVLEAVRKATAENVALMAGTQVILTGGALNISLHSLSGPFAVDGILTRRFIPDVVFLGVAGITFQPGFLVTYQFDDELAVQEAYATRPTTQRVLLIDHSKFGSASGWRSRISPEMLLRHTNHCTLVTTWPDEEREQKRLQPEIDAFRNLIKGMANEPKFNGKEFALQLIDLQGEPYECISLSKVRSASATNDAGDASKAVNNKNNQVNDHEKKRQFND